MASIWDAFKAIGGGLKSAGSNVTDYMANNPGMLAAIQGSSPLGMILGSAMRRNIAGRGKERAAQMGEAQAGAPVQEQQGDFGGLTPPAMPAVSPPPPSQTLFQPVEDPNQQKPRFLNPPQGWF